VRIEELGIKTLDEDDFVALLEAGAKDEDNEEEEEEVIPKPKKRKL